MANKDRSNHHSIYQVLPIPILEIEVAPSFTVISANKAAITLLDKNEQDIIGRKFADVISTVNDDVQPDWDQHIQQACNCDNTPPIRVAVRASYTVPANRYFDIQFTPVHEMDNATRNIVVLITDVTHLVEIGTEVAELKTILSKKDKFLNETQRVSRNGTWEIDLGTSKVLWSDMMREIHEIGDETGLDFQTALNFYKDEETRERLVAVVQDAIAIGSVFDIELEIITAKGNARWIRSTGKADLVDGVCTRLYGTAQDITIQKSIEMALIESRNKHKSLIQSVEGVVWEADARTFEFSYISDQVEKLLGYTADEWLTQPDFWSAHIHPEDRNHAVNFCLLQTKGGRNHTFDYRMVKADGSIVWIKDVVSVIGENGTPALLRGIMVDITETKLLEELDHLEKKVLELNFKKGIEIETVLREYVEGLEKLFQGMKCSVLRVKNNKIHKWVSPSLPQQYIQSIDNLEISPDAGSCGTAAYLKEKVIVADIEIDPKWNRYKHLALPFGIRSSWSFPIMDSVGDAIAVLGIYYDTVKTPDVKEAEIIERSVSILSVILENRLNAEKITETNLLITQGQELANFGTWQWDISKNVVTWSDILYDIYGLDKSSIPATFEGYVSILHPDDRKRVTSIMKNIIETHSDILFEERIVRPDGEERTLKSWGRVILNEDGNAVKVVGASLDITAAKVTQVKLEEIAWLQSHVIRAPLARLMGLVNILQNELARNTKHDELIGHILTTAHEVDDVVRKIARKTE
jgi:PAS domain S-box-containing protein